MSQNDQKKNPKFEVRVSSAFIERVIKVAQKYGVEPSGKEFSEFKRQLLDGGVHFLETIEFVDKHKLE